MQAQSFRVDSSDTPNAVGIELSLKLYSYPRQDREPVKILVIGSREAVTTIVHTLHHLRFAEVLEWTDFLPAPSANQQIQFQSGEVMKALVKYLPRS